MSCNVYIMYYVYYNTKSTYITFFFDKKSAYITKMEIYGLS